ncbi:MAG: hypothetical protein FWG10_05110 [Eubacteriaceae bacterium]|nr:hypothetical protein [Eubacteriaceae bacterium]
MEKLKRIAILALAGILLFMAGCGGNPGQGANTQTTKGKYVETDITPPISGRFVSFLADDGTIVCYSADYAKKFESSDGGASWSEAAGPAAANEELAGISASALLDDGRLLAFIQNKGLGIVGIDGVWEHVALGDIDELVANQQMIMLACLSYLGGGKAIASYNSGVFMVQTQPGGGGGRPDNYTSYSVAVDPETPSGSGQSPGRNANGGGQNQGRGGMENKTLLFDVATGQTITLLDTNTSISGAIASQDNFYTMDSAGNIACYKLSDGSSVPSGNATLGSGQNRGGRGNRIGGMFGGNSNALAAAPDGGLYAFYNDTVFKVAKGNVSSFLDATNYSVGNPNSSASAIHVLGSESVVVGMLEGSGSNRLYKYEWSDTAIVDPSKNIIVWSLRDNDMVRSAIAELRKKNPDSQISYEVALGRESGISASDAIKNLNTRLLSGNGPDVIILDGCPAESYGAKGMLCDLAGLVDTSEVYANLLAPYASSGKIFSIATQFYAPLLMGTNEALSKVNGLGSLVSLVVNGKGLPEGGMRSFGGLAEEERSELYFDDISDLSEVLWLASAPSIIKGGALDIDNLRFFLEAVSSISVKYDLGSQRGGRQNQVRMGMAIGGRGSVARVPSSLMRYIARMSNYGAFAGGNLQVLQIAIEREGASIMPFPGLVEGAWRPSSIAGVSAASKNQEFAIALVEAMLSLNVQGQDYGTGLPVTKEGMDAQIAAINEGLEESGSPLFTFDIDEMVFGLHELSVEDAVLAEMIEGSVEKCATGELDVEGAIKEIEQNIKNYLAERS